MANEISQEEVEEAVSITWICVFKVQIRIIPSSKHEASIRRDDTSVDSLLFWILCFNLFTWY
jgi:hypothetical protein